ncbi:energy transducer TonB [Bradyrhizobium sp. dw_78]|uniref:energy transducer TonB family protein n=1 Tax=Bradyrhizobium sp. dw_78 TaxID=2719793 RepID=UPI001BD3B84A|nr:energy transducer TonB [Bradyrhizobium sp. dw_78]
MIDWRDPDGRWLQKVPALTVLYWSAAALVIAAAHGGVVWLALNWTPAEAAPGEPPPAVMIELAPIAVAPEAPPQDIAPGPQMTEAQPETTPDIPDKPDIKLPELPKLDHAEAVLTPPPPPKPEEKKKPPPKKDVERKKPRDPDRPRAPQTTAPPTSSAQRADRSAAPAAGAAAMPSMSQASWKGALMAHLNRYKRFPSGAAGAGTTMIAFTISRSGQVLSARLVRSSGDAALDEEAVSLPRRASPVPEPPPDVGGGSITLAVPIRFNR